MSDEEKLKMYEDAAKITTSLIEKILNSDIILDQERRMQLRDLITTLRAIESKIAQIKKGSN